ncbi:MAG: hypothetical protein DRO11_01685, partial [Methanobacteriota archaeon]
VYAPIQGFIEFVEGSPRNTPEKGIWRTGKTKKDPEITHGHREIWGISLRPGCSRESQRM